MSMSPEDETALIDVVAEHTSSAIALMLSQGASAGAVMSALTRVNLNIMTLVVAMSDQHAEKPEAPRDTVRLMAKILRKHLPRQVEAFREHLNVTEAEVSTKQ